MQNIGWKIALIVAVIGLCLWSLYPPEQKIRLGTDLRGGTSLIYTVKIPDDAGDKAQILSQTISVLKDRVNPKGVLDISMQPLGLDRIEIVMPLPNERVLALRKEYEAALDSLMAMAEIQPDDLDEALRFNQAVEKFGGNAGVEGRAKDMAGLQEAYNNLQSTTEVLVDAIKNSAAPEVINKAEQAVADAQFNYDSLHESVLKQSLDEQRVVRALALATERQPVRDEKGNPRTDPQTGQPMTSPSQREIALETLKKDFSYLAPQLDLITAAYDGYTTQRTGFDDPEDLIRLLRGAGVLEFHIAVRDGAAEGVSIPDLRRQLAEVGPENTDSAVARWYPINDLNQWADTPEQLASLEADPAVFFSSMGLPLVGAKFEGQYYLLLYTSPTKCMIHEANQRWTVERTFKSPDEMGRTGVSFGLDAAGGGMMSRMTGAHVGEPMAIVLDNQVYSAPRLNSQIGNSGIITGDFSESEINYLIRVLAAGALEARLSERPIAINTLGPTLGHDNLTSGLNACLISIIAVGTFMLIYYFWAGLVADFAVALNGVIIFGVMAMIDGTFTLPGLAGMALTVGTAVDANILINERIREELERGEDLKSALRLGYSKAFSAIMDANITNLIVCIVLIYTATTEVKGFAFTMTIGILGTLFTALFVTRVIFTVLVEGLGIKRMPMLASTVPAVRRFLEPRIDWIRLRWVFASVSTVVVLGSIVLLAMRGGAIFDTQFLGGVSATMRTSFEPDGTTRLMLRHADVERRIHEMGERAHATVAGSTPTEEQKIVAELRNADVLTMGDVKPAADGLVASGFQVKVSIPPDMPKDATIAQVIVAAIVKEFGGELDVTRPLTFAGAGSDSHSQHTFPIASAELGISIQRPQYRDNVKDFRGGVAIVLDGIEPPVTTEQISSRVSRMRDQPDFRDTSGRRVKVFGLESVDPGDPSKGYRSVAVVVEDTSLNYDKVDYGMWDARLASREWALVSQALVRPASLEQVSEFSSAVAETLRANAVVAVVLSLIGILMYIWIRFGSLRYSAGAVIALFHDCIIGLGALALSQYIGATAFGKSLLIDEFHINLEVVAAVLTLIGYSLNDTIVVLDRIRENRGKLKYPTAETVNKSINQTFGRTMLTNLTMLISLLVMYIVGGPGIRAFAFVMLIGMFVGTYSSIAIAAPLVYKGHDEPGLNPATEAERRRRAERIPVAT